MIGTTPTRLATGYLSASIRSCKHLNNTLSLADQCGHGHGCFGVKLMLTNISVMFVQILSPQVKSLGRSFITSHQEMEMVLGTLGSPCPKLSSLPELSWALSKCQCLQTFHANSRVDSHQHYPDQHMRQCLRCFPMPIDKCI